MIANWKAWWAALSPKSKAVPLLGVLAFWCLFFLLGTFDTKTLQLGGAVLLLGYAGKTPRRVLLFLLPLILSGIVYESQRNFWSYRARIRVEEPYLFDLTYFGIDTATGRLTPNEWWQLHTHWFIDLVTGFGYIAFIPIFLLITAAFEFWYARKGTSKLSAAEMALKAPRAMWSFFWVNVLGYATYYGYPAAPPWYVSLHGLGPAKLDAPPNAAGCARFDELLGIDVFQNFYSQSGNIFGAIPSLHVAYPLVAVYFAYKFGALKKTSIAYYLLISFGAVYLNHHYIIDVIWGSVYAIAISWIVGTLPDLVKNEERDPIPGVLASPQPES